MPTVEHLRQDNSNTKHSEKLRYFVSEDEDLSFGIKTYFVNGDKNHNKID